jgi:hypothetical protein
VSPHYYEAFGLKIRSNRPLAGLRASQTTGSDLDVEFVDGAPEVERRAAETTPHTGSGSVRGCEDGGRMLRFASHGGERAWSMRVSGDGRSIDVRWRGPIALADVASFVEVTGLSTALALRGVAMLHGCAIGMGDAAFLVLGRGGAGKSTLAAAAVAGGYPLVTDDIAALDGTGADVRVQVGGGQLRMNSDTASALGWDPSALLRVFRTPGLPPKLFAPLSTANGSLCSGPRRLAAIFVLGERRPGPATIDLLPPAAALRALLRNTYGERVVDARVRARLLPFWTRLAREVPVHAVAPAEGLASAPALIGALSAAAGEDERPRPVPRGPVAHGTTPRS